MHRQMKLLGTVDTQEVLCNIRLAVIEVFMYMVSYCIRAYSAGIIEGENRVHQVLTAVFNFRAPDFRS